MPETFQILDADFVKRPFTPNDDPAKGAKQDAGNTLLEAVVDALTDAILPALTSKVGTRKYGPGTRVAVGAASVTSSAITVTEVLVHATTKMYFLVVAASGTLPVTASTGIPLEPGEKFHVQLDSGQRISYIRDSADGFLHIVPVIS